MPDQRGIRLTFHPGASRRQFLGLSFGLAGVATVAACSTGDPGAGPEGGGEPVDLEGKDVGAMPDYTADSQFTATEPFEVSMFWPDWPDLNIKDSWLLLDHITELTGVTIVPVNVPFSDAVDRRSLLISAGDAPNVIPLVYAGEEKPFVSGRAVVPMSDYVEHMPHFNKYVAEWDLGSLVENLKQFDGKYYMLPGLREISYPIFSLIFRTDVFEDLGLAIPETWDELREALVQIKAENPDAIPLAEQFEGASLINVAATGFGTRAGWGFGDGMIDDGTGVLKYAGTSEEYRALLEYFHGLVQDGLLDPETFTSKNAGAGSEVINQKILRGDVAVMGGAAGTVTELAVQMDDTLGEGNFALQLVPPPAGPAGPMIGSRGFWHGFMLSPDVAESPNFLATLQFLDWLYYNPQALEMTRWGIEGETYTKDADGTITLSPDVSADLWNLNPDAPMDLQKDLGFSTFLADGTESRAMAETYSTEATIEYVDAVLASRTPREPNPPAPLDEMELEQSAILQTPLKDSVDQATLQFILGQRDLAEWDDFVAEMESQGLQQYIDMMNAARERFAEENA
jgi:putative aldouronate transport system substrate-binding protein